MHAAALPRSSGGLICLLVMAALAAAAEEKLKANAQAMALKRAQPRLVADPAMSIGDIARVLVGYMNYQRTYDLWSLLAPPPSVPLQYSWKTSPNCDWLANTMGLLYDFLEIAPNSKVASVKLIAAMKQLHGDGKLKIPPGKSPADFFDKADMTIRILLAMVRNVAKSNEVNSTFIKNMTTKQQVMFKMVLDRMKLPGGDLAVDDESDDLTKQHSAYELVPYKQPAASPHATTQPAASPLPKATPDIDGSKLVSLVDLDSLFSNILASKTASKAAEDECPAFDAKDDDAEYADLRALAQKHQPANAIPKARAKRKGGKSKGVKKEPAAKAKGSAGKKKAAEPNDEAGVYINLFDLYVELHICSSILETHTHA